MNAFAENMAELINDFLCKKLDTDTFCTLVWQEHFKEELDICHELSYAADYPNRIAKETLIALAQTTLIKLDQSRHNPRGIDFSTTSGQKLYLIQHFLAMFNVELLNFDEATSTGHARSNGSTNAFVWHGHSSTRWNWDALLCYAVTEQKLVKDNMLTIPLEEFSSLLIEMGWYPKQLKTSLRSVSVLYVELGDTSTIKYIDFGVLQ